MAEAALLRALFVLFFAVGCSSIDDSCVKCLCEAINGGPTCSYLVGCHDGVCGPYAITWPYWVDGGRPTVGLDDPNQMSTYEKCTLDVTCSEATIRGYMNKFHQDCNKDGVEDCFDFAAVHFHGGYNCNKPLSVPAKNALQECLNRSEGTGGLPHEFPDLDTQNGVVPSEPTTYPSIDIRFGEKEK